MPDITITPQWQTLSSLSGIAAGTETKVQNKGAYPFIMIEAITQPSASSTEGEVATTYEDSEPSKIIPAGSGEVWVRSASDNYNTIAFVQDIT